MRKTKNNKNKRKRPFLYFRPKTKMSYFIFSTSITKNTEISMERSKLI